MNIRSISSKPSTPFFCSRSRKAAVLKLTEGQEDSHGKAPCDFTRSKMLNMITAAETVFGHDSIIMLEVIAFGGLALKVCVSGASSQLGTSHCSSSRIIRIVTNLGSSIVVFKIEEESGSLTI
jgi:hypothetical protein